MTKLTQKKFKVIIPARGGSKGLPGKNIKILNNKPLICYTIDAARGLFKDNDIFVSTDSQEVKQVVENYGLAIPRLRADNLSTDTASTVDVLLDYLDANTDKPDYIVLLQPTSPLRTSKQLAEALELVNDDLEMVVSVSESDANPYWNIFEENSEGYLGKSKEGFFSRRQDVPSVYVYNGAIYIISTNALLKKKSLHFQKIVKYVMDKKSSIDIDDFLDFKMAEFLIKNNE